MTEDQIAYCDRLMQDANTVLRELRADQFERNEAVNWSDLRCVSVERVEEYAGRPDDIVTTWRVLVEEASSTAHHLKLAIYKALVAKGHVNLSVETEW